MKERKFYLFQCEIRFREVDDEAAIWCRSGTIASMSLACLSSASSFVFARVNSVQSRIDSLHSCLLRRESSRQSKEHTCRPRVAKDKNNTCTMLGN